MNLVLTLLLIGASGSAERTLESRDSIAGILGQVALGAMRDATTSISTNPNADRRGTVDQIRRGLRDSDPRLWIDGRPRRGIFAWLAAVDRVCGYVLDRRSEGSVAYSYCLEIQQYNVLRRTRVVNDQVTLTTSTGWVERVPITGRITREVPINVVVEIRATEQAGSTTIEGTARGTAGTDAFRCRVVRAIAEDRAGVELATGLERALEQAETGGRDWYASGASDVLDALRAAIRIGRTRLRSR